MMFLFCKCAKHLHKIPHFNLMIHPSTLVLADKTTLSPGEANRLSAPMGAHLDHPTAEGSIQEQQFKQVTSWHYKARTINIGILSSSVQKLSQGN